MTIKEITFIFENCEDITIEGKYIGNFLARDIRQEISRIACNAINMMEICYDFAIEIHPDANKKYSPFGITDKETTVFQRIMEWNDITQVEIILYDQYSDKPEETEIKKNYLLYWSGDDDAQENPAQSSRVSKPGWLYVVVNEKETVDSVFFDDKNEEDEDCGIDSNEHMDFIASMYDIGDKYYQEHLDMIKKAQEDDSET